MPSGSNAAPGRRKSAREPCESSSSCALELVVVQLQFVVQFFVFDVEFLVAQQRLFVVAERFFVEQ